MTMSATATASVDLSTRYLGLALPHPFMPGASPMVDDLDVVRRLEDAGTAAIVMHSLFEEQIEREQGRTRHDMESHVNAFAEASSFFPRPADFPLGPHAYLDQIRRIKEAVAVPVIASLNGITATGWLDYAKLIEQAGADALELNVYYVATDPDEDGAAVERRTIDIVRAVKQAIRIPIAVKLSRSSRRCRISQPGWRAAGADGLVLFNRFYQPDIDTEALEVRNEAAPLGLLGAPVAAALAGDSLGAAQAGPLGLGRHPYRERRRQGGHGGGTVGAGCVCAPEERAAASGDAARRACTVRRGARLCVALGNARLHESGALSRSGGFRARELHAHPAELAGVGRLSAIDT